MVALLPAGIGEEASMKKPRGCYEEMESGMANNTDGILDDCSECGAPGAMCTGWNGKCRAECADRCGEATDWLPDRAAAMIAWNLAQRKAKLGHRFKGQACGEA